MSAADGLDKNEWPDLAIDSDAFSHYTQMSKIMEQYAKEYHAKRLEEARKQELTKYTKFL